MFFLYSFLKRGILQQFLLKRVRHEVYALQQQITTIMDTITVATTATIVIVALIAYYDSDYRRQGQMLFYFRICIVSHWMMQKTWKTKSVYHSSYCGVFDWLAALTNCWNIFLSFMGSIPDTNKENESWLMYHVYILQQGALTLWILTDLDLSHPPP